MVQPAAIVPVKSFAAAKARLGTVLSAADRERLARWLAGRVVDACAPLPVYVACDDESVAQWAEDRGATVLWGPGLGLNGAIDTAITTVADDGIDHVIVAHGDLPRPESLPSVVAPDTVVLVPDRRRDGTNVLARPTSVALAAQYGAGSFGRHLDAAIAGGHAVTVRVDPFLSIDIDTVDDCRHPIAAGVLHPFLGEAFPR